jgi:hypothetical protein
MSEIMLDKDKYKAAFLYLLEHLGKIEGKKKAYKLFYFLDFDFYEAYDKSFTGETYVALQMGPAPKYFDPIVGEMVKEGMVELEYQRKMPYHENETVTYKPKIKTDYKFSREENGMLDRVIKLYGNNTGKDLEKISHSQPPYNAVNLYDVIPYEYAFYRDTPDLKKNASTL